MKTRLLQLYLILAILWAIISCAPKAIIVEPIAPAVVKAHAQVQAAAVGVKRVQTKVITIHEQAKGIAAEASRMKQETDRLRNIPGVPLNEFDALWLMVTNNQRDAFAHEVHARETVEAAKESETLSIAAETSTAALEPLAKKTDAAVVDLKTQIVKQADDASLGRALKTWVVMSVIVFSIGGILFLVIKLKPGIL